MRILVTEMAGRASIELKGRELGVDLAGHPEPLGRVVNRVKDLEAEAGPSRPPTPPSSCCCAASSATAAPLFALESYRVIVEHRGDGAVVSEATVKVRVGGERVDRHRRGKRPGQRPRHRAAQGPGGATRSWPASSSPTTRCASWAGSNGTDAITRVLVEAADGEREWTTVGVHDNVVEASWLALVDALTYAVHRRRLTCRVRPGGYSLNRDELRRQREYAVIADGWPSRAVYCPTRRPESGGRPAARVSSSQFGDRLAVLGIVLGRRRWRSGCASGGDAHSERAAPPRPMLAGRLRVHAQIRQPSFGGVNRRRRAGARTAASWRRLPAHLTAPSTVMRRCSHLGRDRLGRVD